MSTAQLAAVSFLAQGLHPLVGIERAHVELYIRELGEAGPDGLLGEHDDARRSGDALRAFEAAAVRLEDYTEVLRGHRVLHLVGKSNKPATMPLTVPLLRVPEARRGERTSVRLVLRQLSGEPIDQVDVYRMVRRIADLAQPTASAPPTVGYPPRGPSSAEIGTRDGGWSLADHRRLITTGLRRRPSPDGCPGQPPAQVRQTSRPPPRWRRGQAGHARGSTVDRVVGETSPIPLWHVTRADRPA